MDLQSGTKTLKNYWLWIILDFNRQICIIVCFYREAKKKRKRRFFRKI